jgi:uncharacterized Tic20 family protein
MDEQTNPFDAPQAPIDSSTETIVADREARQWAMFCHLAGLAKYVPIPLSNVLAPLILWQIKKDQWPFADDQGKEAVNFQISITIYAIVCGLLFCVGIGVFLLPVLGVLDLVFIIIAALKANEGELYRYPLTIRFIR